MLENPDEYDIVNPDPGSLIESLRAFGYTLEASIADIIDNSIVAQALNIHIQFTWRGDASTIAVIDDGYGMTEAELINAMRAGSRNPLDSRDLNDLGRFGLGLKTASFSQCRKLTVGSKAKGNPVCIRSWDLDYVNRKREWRLQKVNPFDADPVFSTLEGKETGTVVFWENIDRQVKGAQVDDKVLENHFYEQIDLVKQHLAMVFHRFMESPDGVKIFINNRSVKPWDPFLSRHPSTQILPGESLINADEKITIQPYVLPHRSRLSEREYEEAGGPGSWNARQGFYIYRNKRLIVAGDWLGLGFRREDHTRLARIRVDIPNSMDGDWKIDVKKSVARPPSHLKEDFKRIARLTIERATAIFRHRGKIVERQSAEDFIFPWNTNVKNGTYFYTINRKHPLIFSVLNSSEESRRNIEAMLRLIEETVPIPAIILNNINKPDKVYKPFDDIVSDDLLIVMREVWRALRKTGLSITDTQKRILRMEPFCDYPESVSAILESMEEESR